MYDFADVITIIYFIFRTLIGIACWLFLIWIGVSFLDIIAHNLTSGYEYPFWNFFLLFSTH